MAYGITGYFKYASISSVIKSCSKIYIWMNIQILNNLSTDVYRLFSSIYNVLLMILI